VAHSIDFYPQPHTNSEDGCAQVGLGLGFSVVDNAPAVHISLADPTKLIGPEEHALPVGAFDLQTGIARLESREPLAHGSMSGSVLTADPLTVVKRPPSQRSTMSEPSGKQSLDSSIAFDVHGERVVHRKGYAHVSASASASASDNTSASTSNTSQNMSLTELLNSPTELPLAQALSFLLRMGSKGLGCPVEIEWALQLRSSSVERHTLHVLQIRPQARLAEVRDAPRFSYLPGEKHALVASGRALGHGRFRDIADVVYVSPEKVEELRSSSTFSADPAAASRLIASEIGKINAELKGQGRKYLLMAPGRWGASDPLRGIPVQWDDIDGCGFLVETQTQQADASSADGAPGKVSMVPLSQGSHFFQNILSFGLGYASCGSGEREGEAAAYGEWDKLREASGSKPASQLASAAGASLVRHVKLDSPLEIVVDGASRCGVVMKPDSPFEVYVSQVDAFMRLQMEQASSGQ